MNRDKCVFWHSGKSHKQNKESKKGIKILQASITIKKGGNVHFRMWFFARACRWVHTENGQKILENWWPTEVFSSRWTCHQKSGKEMSIIKRDTKISISSTMFQAWKRPKRYLIFSSFFLKEATFSSPKLEWCLPSPSDLKRNNLSQIRVRQRTAYLTSAKIGHITSITGPCVDITRKQLNEDELHELETLTVFDITELSGCWKLTGRPPISARWEVLTKAASQNPVYRSR